MNGLRQGSFRIFRLFGIDVFLHWSWFIIALIEINTRERTYSSPIWNVVEYLGLFAIVTTHEFGHALACRQVGGVANQIVLWPLGGVAYVDPPPRAAATLWSLAAGPLVNVVLLPILYGLHLLSGSLGWQYTLPDVYQLLLALLAIDAGLLIFNMLPLYPLDGGQILRALLWFPLGRARSLMIATILGFVGMVGFVALVFRKHSVWLGAIAVFMLLNCWAGLQHARSLLRLAKMPRRAGFECPACHAAPVVGEFWSCGLCKRPFDIFQSQGICPNCSARFNATRCIDCGALHSIAEWSSPVPPRPLA